MSVAHRSLFCLLLLTSSCAADNVLTTTKADPATTASPDTTSEQVATSAAPSSASPTTTAPSTAPSTTPSTRTVDEERFLSDLETALSFMESTTGLDAGVIDPEAAIAAGHLACDELEAGANLIDLAQAVATAPGIDAFTASAIAAAATQSLCPEHGDLFDPLLAANSSPDELVIAGIRLAAGDEFVDRFGEQELRDLATSVCDRLEAGESLLDVIFEEVRSTAPRDAQNVGVAIGAGIGVLCPQYLQDVQELFPD